MIRIVKHGDNYTCEFNVAGLKLAETRPIPSNAVRTLVFLLVFNTFGRYLSHADRIYEPNNTTAWRYLQDSLSLALKEGWQVRATSLDAVDMGFDGTNIREIIAAQVTTGLDNIRVFRKVGEETISFGYYYYQDADEYNNCELSLFASGADGLYIDADGNTDTALGREIVEWMLSHLLDKAYE